MIGEKIWIFNAITRTNYLYTVVDIDKDFVYVKPPIQEPAKIDLQTGRQGVNRIANADLDRIQEYVKSVEPKPVSMIGKSVQIEHEVHGDRIKWRTEKIVSLSANSIVTEGPNGLEELYDIRGCRYGLDFQSINICREDMSKILAHIRLTCPQLPDFTKMCYAEQSDNAVYILLGGHDEIMSVETARRLAAELLAAADQAEGKSVC